MNQEFDLAVSEIRNEPIADSVVEAAAARAKESDAWSYHEVATNHMVASNRPDELAAILLDLTPP